MVTCDTPNCSQEATWSNGIMFACEDHVKNYVGMHKPIRPTDFQNGED